MGVCSRFLNCTNDTKSRNTSHMRRANYVATKFNPANMLQMGLESLLEHGLDENLSTFWSDLTFPKDLSDMLFEVTMRVQMTRTRTNTC